MTVAAALRERVSQQAQNRCGYCQVPAAYIYATMEIEHILPKAAGGGDEEVNLWLACPFCNGFKGPQTQAVDPLTRRRVALFNPRQQVWTEHFRWGTDRARIIGRTATGRATVRALRLNYESALEFRTWLVQAGVYPPKSE
jgi:hypothetical protein